LADAVAAMRRNGARVLVRVNAGERQREDALAACRAGADGLSVPKARSAEEFAALADVLAPEEAKAGRAPMAFVAVLEGPGALLDDAKIARGPRLIALSLGGEDFALAIGGEPTPEVLRVPKLMVHYAAKAAGLLSLGLLRSVADYSD